LHSTSLAVALVRAEAPRRVVIDGLARDHQHRSDGEDAKRRRQPEDGDETELPAEETGERRARHVAGVVERLVAAVLAVEALLPGDAEGDPGDGGADGGAGDGGGDLGAGDNPEVLRHPDQSGRENGEDARNDHVKAFAFGGVHQRARRGGDDHAGDAAQRHHEPDGAGRPAPLLQEDAQKRADPRLHVGHEEVQRFQRRAGALLVRLRPGRYHLIVPFSLGPS
jgi:hypothetical protein